jgi:phosphomevalonate kinase
MRIMAPGKLVLTGAYAVLEGAPAIVVAVDRYALAEAPSPAGEVNVDVRALQSATGQKLGLGSSAATLVASHAARALARGEDPRHGAVRSQIFQTARAAHAREQGGGSGVDIAASVHGGALRYRIGSSPNPEAEVRAVDLPRGLVLHAFWSGTSARTSDLLGRVHGLRVRGGADAVFKALRAAAIDAADGVGNARTYVDGAVTFARALAALGDAADAPIFLPAFTELAALAEREQGAFLPSGAGGGDVAVWLGTAAPSAPFVARARELSLQPLALAVDHGGVRPESPS